LESPLANLPLKSVSRGGKTVPSEKTRRLLQLKPTYSTYRSETLVSWPLYRNHHDFSSPPLSPNALRKRDSQRGNLLVAPVNFLETLLMSIDASVVKNCSPCPLLLDVFPTEEYM